MRSGYLLQDTTTEAFSSETLSACPRTKISGIKEVKLFNIYFCSDLDPDGSVNDLVKNDYPELGE